MTFSEYQTFMRDAFPKAVSHAIEYETLDNPVREALSTPAWDHFSAWGFSCMADAWSAAVPRSDRLELFAWSLADLEIDCCRMDVSARALHLSANFVHIEVRDVGQRPLPFTETGYRSFFVSLLAFRKGVSIEDFIRALFPETRQMQLL